MTAPVHRRATYDDVLRAPPNVVAEVLFGVLHTHPRPTLRHANASSHLGGLLFGPFRIGQGGPGGWAIYDEPELHLGAEPDIVVPDLAGWRRERLVGLADDVAFTVMAPDWICEVLSAPTQAIDRAEKMEIYLREQVGHVWLVDPIVRTLEVYRRDDGVWQRVAVHRDDVSVRVEPFDAIELRLVAVGAVSLRNRSSRRFERGCGYGARRRPPARVSSMTMHTAPRWASSLILLATACGGGTAGDGDAEGTGSASASASASAGEGLDAAETGVDPPTAPACTPGSAPQSSVAEPTVLVTLADSWQEAWLASPAVADLDGDGTQEIIVPRADRLVVWTPDGAVKWTFDTAAGRIWASPVVADLDADGALEVAIASRDQVFVLEADGSLHPGSPMTWEDELRSLAAGQLDGDAPLELVVAPAHGGPTDVIQAFDVDGGTVPGFPPNAAGSSGCDDACYLAGCFDQNLAVGDLDGDGLADIVAPHDNAYASIHRSTGEAFDAAPGYPVLKTPGVRYLHDLALAQQGYADDEETADQAHFTNTAPAIADIDGDGTPEVIMVGSVQNAAQTDRERGVALWVVGFDAARRPGFEAPFHAPGYLAGLWDFDGTNVVAATNQVSVADLDPAEPGLELVFADFAGNVHAVSSDGRGLWSTSFTTSSDVLTGGLAIADLSADGIPELVFSTYSPNEDQSALFVLDAGGNVIHQLPLPHRGAMPVPTIADVDGDGTLEILVSLKDADDGVESVRVYTVPGSETNCMPWPTGRGNLLRNGWVPPA